MKSAKVVNKILLISLAFGSITFVAGILAEGNLKKTLMGLGATTSVVSIAGTLLTKDKNKSNDENQDVQYEDALAVDPSVQKEPDYSADESDRMMHAVETDVNSLQTEDAQPLEFVSNLNSRKEELEAQHDSNEPEIEPEKAESSIAEELEVENSDRDFGIVEPTYENEELEESLSPIDESFTSINAEETQEIFDSEPFTTQTDWAETNNIADNVEENINPFVSSSELSESEPEEDTSDTEIADKLFGTFDPAKLETDDELLIEEDESEEIGFEAASMAESELLTEELAIEETESEAEEFSFDNDLAIASDTVESVESELPIEELVMEDDDDSSDEFDFGEELATSTESELDSSIEETESEVEEFSFDNDLAIASDTVESVESELPIEELEMEDDSSDEFNFGEELATSTESELDSSIEDTESEAEEFSFDNDLATSTESELDSSIEETESEAEEFSFDNDLAIASDTVESVESGSPIEELVYRRYRIRSRRV